MNKRRGTGILNPGWPIKPGDRARDTQSQNQRQIADQPATTGQAVNGTSTAESRAFPGCGRGRILDIQRGQFRGFVQSHQTFGQGQPFMADGVRFELTVRLHARRFSRPLP